MMDTERTEPSRVVLQLSHSEGNPRNSEGAFARLADGRIMFAYTRYRGGNWHDHDPADIAARYSCDGGDTWSGEDRLLLPNEGRCNIMSVSLLRPQDGRLLMFYLVKNSALDCRLHVRASPDEGESWGEPVCCIRAPGYFVVNNDRVVQLQSGRLVAPAACHRPKSTTKETEGMAVDPRGIAIFFLSDDGGSTWYESDDRSALPTQSESGLQEPGVVQLRDGSILAWARTDTGRQWMMRSADGARTWSRPRESRFASPLSPMSMKRIPSTGHLLAVWNDAGHPAPAAASSWGRTPLSAAVSVDEGVHWNRTRHIEVDPDHGYCYTAMHFVGDAVLLAYCCGGGESAVLQDLRLRKIAIDWFYPRRPDTQRGPGRRS